MKKLLALLLLVTGVVFAQQTATTTTGTLDPNQIYNTGNVVQMTTTTSGSTWVNGVYQDQLTCWGWGDPGNCGPNPSVRPGNYINYSYGYTDLYQVQAIASILPTTGLRVNGYNFGFTAKNGNGWDDARVDQLNAYVTFYGTDGKIKDYTNYDLNSKFEWTNFNYSKTFVTPYADKDLSTVQYGFTGKDNNFWAGNYGPEIMNVSFSLKYSVDPCAVNVLSSPTCPGYLDALLKSIPTTTTDSSVSTASIPPPPPPPEAALPPPPPGSPPTPTSTASVGQPSVVASVVSAPAPPPGPTQGPASTTNSNTSSSQVTKETISSGGGNVSLALSIISKNSERDAAGSAVAQSAVAQAQSAANQAQQEASSVAASAVSNSLSVNAVSTNNQQSSGNGIRVNNNTSSSTNFSLQSGQTSVASVISGSQSNSNMLVQQQSNSTGISVMTYQPVVVTSVNSQQSSATTFTLPLLQPQQPSISAPTVTSTQTEQQVQVQSFSQPSATQQTETYSLLTPNMLTDKTNPLTDIIEGKQNIPQNNTTAMTGPVVNKNSQDNDIAGGVSINKMATSPAGYGDYLSFAMRDVAFYSPKEVYKNQRNVDNARVLRLLTNDSKHKEMVEMQYAR